MKRSVLYLQIFCTALFAVDFMSIPMYDKGLGIMNTSIALSSHSPLTNPANTLNMHHYIISYNPGYSGFGINEMTISGSVNFRNIAPNIHILSQNHDKMANIFLNLAHGFTLKENVNIGFSIDYINPLAAKLGLQVEFISGHTWQQYLDMIRSHDLDVMMKDDQRLGQPIPQEQRETEPMEQMMAAFNEVEQAAKQL